MMIVCVSISTSRYYVSLAVIFIPIPLPEQVLQTSSCTILLYKFVLQTGLGMGMGTNGTAYGRFPLFQSSNFQFERIKSEQINCGCVFDTMSDFNVPGSRPKQTQWNFGNRPYTGDSTRKNRVHLHGDSTRKNRVHLHFGNRPYN